MSSKNQFCCSPVENQTVVQQHVIVCTVFLFLQLGLNLVCLEDDAVFVTLSLFTTTAYIAFKKGVWNIEFVLFSFTKIWHLPFRNFILGRNPPTCPSLDLVQGHWWTDFGWEASYSLVWSPLIDRALLGRQPFIFTHTANSCLSLIQPAYFWNEKWHRTWSKPMQTHPWKRNAKSAIQNDLFYILQAARSL